MKRTNCLRLLLFILTAAFEVVPLSGCRNTQGTGAETDTDGGTQSDTSTDPDTPTRPDGEPRTEPETDPDTDPVPAPVVVPDGEWGKSIAGAYEKANSVDAYYTSGARTTYHFGNDHISADYPLTEYGCKLTTDLRSPSGGLYLSAGLDVFVQADDGTKYYASASAAAARVNIFRYGLYCHELRFLDQTFAKPGKGVYDAELDIPISSRTFSGHDIADRKVTDGVLSYTVKGADPYVSMNSKKLFDAADYNALLVTIRVPASVTVDLYFLAGSYSGHNEDQVVHFTLKDNGEFNTYLIPLDGVKDYTGSVSSLRFDVNAAEDTPVEISSVKAVKLSSADFRLVLDHTFHLYTDKLNSVAHVVSQADQDGIAAIGHETSIPADTVAAVVVGDAAGVHTSLDGVAWDSAEFIGFDVKGAGILGFILLPDETSGSLRVTLADGQYTVVQSRKVKNGRLNNGEAFYIGQRVYTDENHTFDAFLAEAAYERHPLTGMKESYFLGYDALRGAYTYKLGSTGFNPPYFTEWNHHYTAPLSLTNSGSADRTVYVLTTSTSGCLENAAIFDERNLMLPIQPEVHKNFSEGEEPVFNPGDIAYGETLFPLTLSAGQTLKLTVLNMYQNWGLYPLKQLSSIQFIAPYYHLSTGVTETSCVAPWYVSGRSLWTLPDFRPMSAPFWFTLKGEYYSNQPQHTHGGYQYFLQYTDVSGTHYASENTHNEITSVGPTYASVDMFYISDDGRIKVTYTHTEMPQTDEHRVYYEMKYEVLEDVSFKSFRSDFNFYSAYAYAGRYQTIGWLDADGNFKTDKTNGTASDTFVTLGNDCPYFALYHYKEYAHNGSIDDGNNTNLGCSIKDWSITVGGETYTGPLMLALADCGARLTLDLDEVTLKKGDTMRINMVIGPWGYEKSDDDSNVRDIRKDSCLHPLTVVAQKGTVTQDGFLPTVKTDDGKTAEFTLSGGNNNCAVRIDGFTKLTAPKLMEKVDGKWVAYDLSSTGNPDENGEFHYYDGYAVYYNGDGTYSYSFVCSMTDSSRTFRIDCSEDFGGWPGEELGFDVETHAASTPFGCAIDMINGIGEPGDRMYNNRGSGTGVGQDIIDFGNTTFDGGKLVISGWCMAEGGIKKYVFSADGGKTWQDMTLYGKNAFDIPNDGICAAAAGKAGLSAFKDKLASGRNGAFQGGFRTEGQAYGANAQGIMADLSDYTGKTLTVLIGAVPFAAPDEICVLVQINNVTVIP